MTEVQKKQIKEIKGKSFTEEYMEDYAKRWDETIFLLKNGRKKHE